MAQWVRSLAAKPDNLSLTPPAPQDPHECRTDFLQVSSDFHRSTGNITQAHPAQEISK